MNGLSCRERFTGGALFVYLSESAIKPGRRQGDTHSAQDSADARFIATQFFSRPRAGSGVYSVSLRRPAEDWRQAARRNAETTPSVGHQEGRRHGESVIAIPGPEVIAELDRLRTGPANVSDEELWRLLRADKA